MSCISILLDITFNKESNHTFNKKDSFDLEFNKLNQEIEFLKLQLQDEKNSNFKLTDEISKIKGMCLLFDLNYSMYRRAPIIRPGLKNLTCSFRPADKIGMFYF